VYYSLTYGKIEMEHEKKVKKKYGSKHWSPFFGSAFFLWTALIIVYAFYYDSIKWFYKISEIEQNWIKILGMIIMCFGFLLNILFTSFVGKSIKTGIIKGEKPELVVNGIYRYIRHPGYLAFELAVFGTFLIIPCILTLALFLFTAIVSYGHAVGEEKILLKIYGEEYEKYRKDVGRFLPKWKRGD
jgi:protein-S-isoprenylcysteine O-methyltransferase Ste14